MPLKKGMLCLGLRLQPELRHKIAGEYPHVAYTKATTIKLPPCPRTQANR